jgi:hypothetical protein
VFSLSPLWLLTVAGMVAGLGRLRSGRAKPGKGPEADGARLSGLTLHALLAPRSGLAMVTLLTLVVTVVVIGFYLIRTDNYGGWTNGLRWLMWLSPLWLLTMLPVADRLGATRRGRAVAYVLLAVSVLSVNYSAWNPWRHPWLYHLMQEQGWIPY